MSTKKDSNLNPSIAESIIAQAAHQVAETNDKVQKEKVFDTVKAYAEMQNVHKIPFPVKAFPDITSKTITSWQRCSNLPAEYFAITMLVTASTMIGNKIKLKINSRWSESPMLYGAIIGPNGIGKSAVWGYALQPINELQRKYAKELYKELQEYKIEVGDRAVSNRSTTDLEEPKEKLVKIDKTTMEFLFEAMWHNPQGILLFRDELKGWLMSMNQYRAGDDLQVFLEVWNNVDKSKRIKQNSFNIDRTFMNILGAIQPSLIKSLATGENVANGLFQRFLYAYPYEFKRGKYSEIEPDPAVQNRYLDIMDYLTNLPSLIKAPESKWDVPCFDPITIEMSEDAKKEWIKHHDYISEEYNKEEDENVGGVLSKQDRYCARLALIIRFIRLAEQNYNYDQVSVKPEGMLWIENPEDLKKVKVELEDVQAAMLMSKYFQHQSMRILDKVGNPAMALTRDKQIFYKALPNEFTVAQAEKIIEQLTNELEGFKMSKRTLQRLLNNESGDLFHKGHRGYYSKKWEI